MSEDQNQNLPTDVDITFLKSKRGILKAAQMATLLVAFVSFTTAYSSRYLMATGLEMLITALLILLYILKLHKTLTFFFWPLVDIFNSVFAAVYFFVLSIMAITRYTVAGKLAGGLFGLMAVALLGLDSFLLFKSITFNQPRSETINQQPTANEQTTYTT